MADDGLLASQPCGCDFAPYCSHTNYTFANVGGRCTCWCRINCLPLDQTLSSDSLQPPSLLDLSQPDADPLSQLSAFPASDSQAWRPRLQIPSERDLHEILEGTTLSPGDRPNQVLSGSFEEPWVYHYRTDSQFSIMPNDYYTPTHTTQPSIAEEMFATFSKSAYLFGNLQPSVEVRNDDDFYFQRQHLLSNVERGFKVQAPSTGAQDSPIFALQKALSFHLQPRRVPPAPVQLQNLWTSIRSSLNTPAGNSPVEPLSGYDLASILEQYNLKNAEGFELVIVSKPVGYEHYTIEVPIPRALGSTYIFLLYDTTNASNLFNRWAAIIPDHTPQKSGSYADALTAPVPPPPSKEKQPVNESLLHPGYTSPVRTRPLPLRPALSSQQRVQSRRRGTSIASSRKGKRSIIASRPPSEAGEQPVNCTQCSETFSKRQELV
jgi:hypothetical protein